MSDIDVIAEVADYTRREFIALADDLSQAASRRTRSVARSNKQGFKNVHTPIDEKILPLLLEAVSSNSTEFTNNRYVSCLLLAINLLLGNGSKNPALVEGVRAQANCVTLEDRDIAILSKTLAAIQDAVVKFSITDAQLFGDQSVDVLDIVELRASLGRVKAAYPSVFLYADHLSRLCDEATESSLAYKQLAEDTMDMETAEVQEEINEYRRQARLIEDSLASRNITSMTSLTYPNRNATCECGVCGKRLPAEGIIFAKYTRFPNTSAANESIVKSLTGLQSFIFSRSGTKSLADVEPLPRCGVVKPVMCSECGALNIVSAEFLWYLKQGVLEAWDTMQTPDVDSTLVYSADIVTQSVERVRQSFARQDMDARNHMLTAMDVIAESMRPNITSGHTNRAIAKLPRVDELFTAETYAHYLAELKQNQGALILDDQEELSIRYLKYMLHFTGASEDEYTFKALFMSLLDHSPCREICQKILSEAVAYYNAQTKLCKCELLYNAYQSECIGQPLAGYIDCILYDSTFDRMYDDVKDGQDDKLQRDAQSFRGRMNELQTKADTHLSAIFVHGLAEQLASALQDYLSEKAAEDIFNLSEEDAPREIDQFVQCGVAARLFSRLKSQYKQALLSAVISKSDVLLRYPAATNGIFRVKKWRAGAIQLCKNLGTTSRSTVSDIPQEALIQIVKTACEADREHLLRALGLSERELLQILSDKLPTCEEFKQIIYNTSMDSLGYGDISRFNTAVDLDAGASSLLSMEEDTAEYVNISDALALAECAAYLYKIITPYRDRATVVDKELSEQWTNAVL